jgi:hypothetical protein
MTPSGADAAAEAGAPTDRRRPGIVLGLLAGAGLQVVDVVLMFILITIASQITVGEGGLFIVLLPFIVVLAGSALLMLSWYWRWFAFGVLLVTAVVAIIVIAPALGLLTRA